MVGLAPGIVRGSAYAEGSGHTPRLLSGDLERTVNFYTQILGFRTCVLWPADRPTFAILERDGRSVQFSTADASGGERPQAGYTLCLDVDDVRTVHALISPRVPVEWGPEVYHYGRREFGVRDPDGHWVIFTELTDDPPTCKEEPEARSA